MSFSAPIDERTEWLEADGLGGFASASCASRLARYSMPRTAKAVHPV